MYSRCNQLLKATSIWNNTVASSITPNIHVYCTMFSICAQLKDRSLGDSIYQHMISHKIVSDIACYNALLNMYIKCGSFFHAISLWRKMEKTANITPNITTYTNVLIACGEVGSISVGMEVHKQVDAKKLSYDAMVDSCMIKMYSNCGRYITCYSSCCPLTVHRIDKAIEVFETSRNFGRVNVVVWTTAILALAQHGQAQKALSMFDHFSMQ